MQQAAEKIKDIVAAINNEKSLDESHVEESLEVLREYECWAPFFRLLKRNLSKKNNKRRLEDYTLLAFIQNVYLEDVLAAAETSAQLVSNMKVTFEVFQRELTPRVVGHEDWTTEATILNAVVDKFSAHEDKVAVLERLCLLYEKKIFNEVRLSEVYTKLLEADPANIKALRYFKIVFTQNYEWEKVVDILKRIIAASRHPQSVFRVAQELAAVHLYQLDQPQAAIEVVESHCEGSPLDTSTIHFDAYQRLADWPGCLRVLREALLGVEDDGERAILHFRIGELEERLENLDVAKQEYEKAIHLWPRFMEPYENLVAMSVAEQDWMAVRRQLKKISDKVDDYGTRAKLTEAVARLDEGLKQNPSD